MKRQAIIVGGFFLLAVLGKIPFSETGQIKLAQ